MTERVKRQLTLLQERAYRSRRVSPALSPKEADIKFSAHTQKSEAERFVYAISLEKEAVFHGDDLFGFNRYSEKALEETRFGNTVIDYAHVLSVGLCGILDEISQKRGSADATATAFYDAVTTCYEACLDNITMYREAAKKEGNDRLATALAQVPAHGARDYYEALITVRFLSYILRIARTPHLPLGRFDVYMKPYYEASLAKGESEECLLELTELFFIAMNLDTDLYFGIQKGDNGQSLVLGGVDRMGNNVFGPLSEMCLTASEELALIDPKINIRVSKSTPLSLYERGTRLTKQGLGFPQYTCDDLAIPYLTSLGYTEGDARDYSFAACWELLSSGNGADVPNVGVLSFPTAVDRAMRAHLAEAVTFDDFLSFVREEIVVFCERIMALCNQKAELAHPLLSSFLPPCIEKGRDLSEGGAKYNNFGIHGAGISTAADSLKAICEGIYTRRDFAKDTLIAALDANFTGYGALRKVLLSYPKMGQNDQSTDALAAFLLDTFASALNGKPNARHGVFRAGTGTAHEYFYTAKELGATADGRLAFAPFSANLSPSHTARSLGPLSVISSFARLPFANVMNGGPFTVEFHDTVFRNAEGERKVAALIKSFIDLGGHQIQINAVNRDVLLDAKAHPERYPSLIVRVWGWSGYFCELESMFQDHIIQRAEFTV